MAVETAIAWTVGIKDTTSVAQKTSRASVLESLVLDLRPSLVALQECDSQTQLHGYQFERGTGNVLTAFHPATSSGRS